MNVEIIPPRRKMTFGEMVAAISAYESDELDEEEVIDLFQSLLDTGTIMHLQGAYQRVCAYLIQEGLICGRTN